MRSLASVILSAFLTTTAFSAACATPGRTGFNPQPEPAGHPAKIRSHGGTVRTGGSGAGKGKDSNNPSQQINQRHGSGSAGNTTASGMNAATTVRPRGTPTP